MAYPVTTAGSFTCANSGLAALASQAKLTVENNPVMPFPAVKGLGPYQGCTYQSGPCTTTTWVSDGSAAKLTVGAVPVLLGSVKATAGNPAPAANVIVTAGQTKLTTS